ncbi:CRISPR-associated protein Cas4 [Caproicibacterium lactatifermentans]
MMVYYYFVCQRKLYYFCKNLRMEQDDENVAIGKVLDETAYSHAEKHITVNNQISVDYIEKSRILHEVKKSRSIEEAGIWQLKYYLWYFKQRGVEHLTGKIDYPLLKHTESIALTKEDEAHLLNVMKEINAIQGMKTPPPRKTKKICKKCAYYDLCFI